MSRFMQIIIRTLNNSILPLLSLRIFVMSSVKKGTSVYVVYGVNRLEKDALMWACSEKSCKIYEQI